MFTGRLDHASRTRISGWALDPATPHQPVALLITSNGILLDRVIANTNRPDLTRAGIGTGAHGFDLFLPTGLTAHERHLIRVTCERDGTELAGSPLLIDPPHNLDAVIANLSHLLDNTADPTDLTSAIIALRQTLNRQLTRRSKPDPTALTKRALTKPKPRALVIDALNPCPHHNAGANAITAHLHGLTRLGYEVHFAAADALAEPPPTLPDITHHAASIGSIEELLTHQSRPFDLIYLHRLTIAARYLPMLRHHCPRAHIVYSVADLHHLRLGREAAFCDLPQLLPRIAHLRRTELALAQAADAVITHSTSEADLLCRAISAPNLHIVPWAIAPNPVRSTLAQRTSIGFIGHFGHNPNLEAATRLIYEILPALHQADPAIHCLIAGSAMPITLRAQQAANLALLPNLDDAQIFWSQLRLSVAPMAFGAGVKGKVLDSFAAGIPCLMSPIAAEGLSLPPALQSLIVADLNDFPAAILALHANPTRLRALSRAGLDYIREFWSPAAQDRALHAACTPLLKSNAPDRQLAKPTESTNEPHPAHRAKPDFVQSR